MLIEDSSKLRSAGSVKIKQLVSARAFPACSARKVLGPQAVIVAKTKNKAKRRLIIRMD